MFKLKETLTPHSVLSFGCQVFSPSLAMRCLKELTHEKLFINAIRKTCRDTGSPPYPSSTLILDSCASPMSVLRYQEIFIFWGGGWKEEDSVSKIEMRK